jgi:RimJ/RimL family protein N-acetyltransferase
MMGAFDGERMIGYFFLRFFANKKCFVGRIIDKDYRGKGVGLTMNKIMYETAWGMFFRCYSTISNNNKAVIKAHAKNSSMKIRKELANDYLLVEFIREKNQS